MRCACGIALALCLFSRDARAQTLEKLTAQDLKRLSIEELAELDVTSVSRRVERLSESAAAVSVVRQDDIRRTGVVSLAEAMRLADGLDVARFEGRTWAISARGFNITTANKLLVLMDGRTLYSPLFAGTFWDVQDMLLADIDRIEVIRGPGGTIWGANAVNGVVNIITKEAATTRGNTAFLATGNEQTAIASARHGGRLGGSGSYRVYGKYRRRGANMFASGESANDPLQFGQGGFRFESGVAGRSSWSLQGDLYRGSEGLFDRDDTDVSGGNVLGRWVRRYSPTSELQVQAYYDRVQRHVPRQFDETRNTVDLDTQHRLQAWSRHDIVFGAGFRVTSGRDIGSAGFFFEPERRTDTLVSAFAQDEIAILPAQRLYLTVGSKFERTDFTGVEVQPTVRLRWTRNRETVWGAVSRAVRLPTRFDTDLRLLNPTTGALTLSGNEDFEPERVIAYEAGYRVRPHPRLAVDVAGFVNRYDDLRTQEFPSRLGAVVLLGNTLNATTRGVETAASIQLLNGWRLHPSYTYLHKDLSHDPGSRDIRGGRDEGNDPSYFLSLRSYIDLPRGFALDGFFRHIAERPLPPVPAYSELDLRLGWIVQPGWEISLVGQNLLHARHPEFGELTPLRYEFERGLYVRSAWRF